MSKILLLFDTPSLLVKSMGDLFTTKGHYVITSNLDMKELGKITEKQDAIIIFADGDLSDNTEELVYIKDKAAEQDSAIFAAGDETEINVLKKTIKESQIQGIFQRPVNIKNVVDFVDAYLKDEKRLAKKKILVVDDSGAMLRNVKGWLEDKYQVILANSGAMAIKYLTLDRPDLVLLDYEMPIIDGKQVLQMI